MDSSSPDYDTIQDCPDCNDNCGCPLVDLYYPSQGVVPGLVRNDPDSIQYFPGEKVFTNDVYIDPSAQYDSYAYPVVSLLMTAQNNDGSAGQVGGFYVCNSETAQTSGTYNGAIGMTATFNLGNDTTKTCQSFALLGSNMIDQGYEKSLFSLFSFDPDPNVHRGIAPAFAIGRSFIGQYCSLADGTLVKGGLVTSTPNLSTFLTGSL